MGSFEIYRKFEGSSLKIERTTVHVSDDSGRIAMLEKRTLGTDPSLASLLRYIYSNHLQSASLELDENAAIISYEEYHPYGTTSYQAINASINAVAKRYRYTGKERDEESGLYYHGARYYIPWLGRWTAVDPLESKYAGMSPYNYCANNPVIFIDDDGREIRISFQKFDTSKTKENQPKIEVVTYRKGRLYNTDGSVYSNTASEEAHNYFIMVSKTLDDVRSTHEIFESLINFMENDRIGSEKIIHYIGNTIPRLEGVRNINSDFGKNKSKYEKGILGNSQVQFTSFSNSTSTQTPEQRFATNNSVTIRFRPQEDIKLLETELGLESNEGTVLTHELKHLWNSRIGISVMHQSYFNETNLSYEEIDAMHFENIYRLAKGMEPRIIYSLKDGGRKLTEKDIIHNLRNTFKLSREPFKNNTNPDLQPKTTEPTIK